MRAPIAIGLVLLSLCLMSGTPSSTIALASSSTKSKPKSVPGALKSEHPGSDADDGTGKSLPKQALPASDAEQKLKDATRNFGGTRSPIGSLSDDEARGMAWEVLDAHAVFVTNVPRNQDIQITVDGKPQKLQPGRLELSETELIEALQQAGVDTGRSPIHQK